jgi:short-subunit dehydrogenase
VLLLTKALLPHFIKIRKGHFVTVTSLMGNLVLHRSVIVEQNMLIWLFFDVFRMEHQKTISMSP